MNNFNDIEEKLNFLAYRIKERAKLNLLDINIQTEIFCVDLLNLVYGWNLVDINREKSNAQAIDLIDKTNKIIIQISSIDQKRKIEMSLQASIMLSFQQYTFKYLCLASNADKLRKMKYSNPYNIRFNPKEDILDISKIINEILYLSIEQQEKIKLLIENEFDKMASNIIDENENSLVDELEKAFERIKNSDNEDLTLADKAQKKYSENYMHKMDELIKNRKEKSKDILEEEGKSFGKKFTIIEQEDTKTRFFEVYFYIDYSTKKKIYRLEKVRHAVEEKDGVRKITFFIDDPQEDGNRMVMVSIDEQSNVCIVNNAILIEDEVHMPYKAASFNISQNIIKGINRKNCFEKYFDIKYDSNILIYDVTMSDVVSKEEYYDETSQLWKDRIKVQGNHKYIALKCFGTDTRVSDKEIGDCYLYGLYDFPQNTFKAMEYYEKDNSSESNFQIGRIFIENPKIRDKNEGIKYIKRAIEMGNKEAEDYFKRINEN